jgi:hypothetical protein
MSCFFDVKERYVPRNDVHCFASDKEVGSSNNVDDTLRDVLLSDQTPRRCPGMPQDDAVSPLRNG